MKQMLHRNLRFCCYKFSKQIIILLWLHRGDKDQQLLCWMSAVSRKMNFLWNFEISYTIRAIRKLLLIYSSENAALHLFMSRRHGNVATISRRKESRLAYNATTASNIKLVAFIIFLVLLLLNA